MKLRSTIPRILVAEDDPENRDAMVRVLDGTGFKTVNTDNGEQALDRILKQNINIVISDLRLPGMDGIELLKRAKTRFALSFTLRSACG
jgi:CheY-like chemotaxis protein